MSGIMIRYVSAVPVSPASLRSISYSWDPEPFTVADPMMVASVPYEPHTTAATLIDLNVKGIVGPWSL
jgi:hypothetical protein